MIEFVCIKNDDEIRDLAAFAKSVWNEYWPVLLNQAQIDYMVENFQSYEAIKKQIQKENYIYKIISENGEKAGYLGVCVKDKKAWESDNPDIGFKYLFLSKLYMKKECRGKGFGRKAFGEVCKIADEAGVKFIYLTVNKNNVNTIKVYEKWGFKTVETAVTDIGRGFVMDDYIMKYDV